MTIHYLDPGKHNYQVHRVDEWNKVADKMHHWRGWGSYYHNRLSQIYSSMIPPGSRVLDIGCRNGDLLASLKPELGVGVELSPAMVDFARELHPNLTFFVGYEDEFTIEGKFDFIILSDLLNELWDVQGLLEHALLYSTPRTRLIINSYNRLWEPSLEAAEKLGVSKPMLGKNWLMVSDIRNLLNLTGYEVIKVTREILLPFKIPLLEKFFNRFLVRFWPFNQMALTNVIVARPEPSGSPSFKLPLVSVVVPARNESGNIDSIFQRVPEMGAGTELIFVEGNSTDDTYEAIQRGIANHPQRRCQLLQQEGKGKGDAVRKGFAHASGDIFMILDADLTVIPEDLPRFYNSLVTGKGEFINGVRLVYPMENEAMRFFNLLGNKFFSSAFSWLLGQTIKDTLCGTKVLWREDYQRIVNNRSVLGDFDPFGDFDLLFGAALLNLKIVDLPIRYRARVYGETNIQRWKHGWLLLRMVLFAARKLKFV